ncbi:amino acid permease-domain-containing protein [Aspergillus venezuelensis]
MAKPEGDNEFKNPLSSGASNISARVSVSRGDMVPAVHFNLWSALGIQYSLTAAPLALGLYLSLVIGLDGPPVFIRGFLFVGIMQLPVCLAMAELASALPNSSGPSYWSAKLAPPKAARFIGYRMGCLTMAAWIFILSSTLLYLAQVTMALAAALNPGFAAARWHVYLVITRRPLFPTIALINATSIYLIAVIFVRANPKQSAETIFFHFVNESGWSSNGIVFFIGWMPAMSILSLFDNATHIIDELDKPTKQVPQVMIGSYTLSFVTDFPVCILYKWCNVNPEALLAPVGGQPIVQLLLDTCDSKALLTISIVSFLVCFSMVGNAVLISSSRLYWSLSTQGMLPFSKWCSKQSSTDRLPINALLLTTALTLFLGAISLGSTTAMNAIMNASGVCYGLRDCAGLTTVYWYGRVRNLLG